ncbi:hypothetical protein CHS0354_025352, partial [Potamilus streckersoni]
MSMKDGNINSWLNGLTKSWRKLRVLELQTSESLEERQATAPNKCGPLELPKLLQTDPCRAFIIVVTQLFVKHKVKVKCVDAGVYCAQSETALYGE